MGLSQLIVAASPFVAIEDLLYRVWSILVAISIPVTTIAFIYYATMLVASGSSEKKASDAKKGIKRVFISWCIIGGYFAFRAMVMWLGSDFGAK